jgi:glyoxylase-like metal-dependent hydrolase (beta-lactamase superfamily II)
MGEIQPDDLSARLERGDGDLLVVDIRHPDEFAEWHVPGSENVDVYDELRDDPDAAARRLDALPEDPEIVTVCAAGKLSQRATETLESLGYDAATLVDGMAGWSRVHRTAPIDADLDGTLVQVARPGTGCLSHVLVSDGEAAVFDPSSHLDEYDAVLDEYDAALAGVFDTHAHADHVSGGRALADRHDVPYHLHPADAEAVDAEPLADGQVVAVGDVDVEVIHTPGHSPGSVTVALEDEALLTGDTLFHDSVGRVELGVEAGLEETDAAENAAALYEALQRLREREGDPLVLPAHDPGSPDPPVAARMSEVETRNSGLGRGREEFVTELANDVPEHPPNFERIKRVNVGAAELEDGERSSLELGPNRCAAE